MKKIIMAAVTAGVLVVLATVAPDVKRYLRIRSM
jgi:hypothetical protein